MTSLKTSIKTITYLSDIGCLEIQGASLGSFHYLKNNSLKYRICNTEKTQNHTLNKNLIIKQICMDKLQDEI
ncbi:hypothetical protein DUN12_26330 [Escherichia coli]|nr:hypothetical protein [Escherichia coli]